MENELRKRILDANIDEHRLEAQYYDEIHTEIFNSFEQRRIEAVLDAILRDMPAETPCLDVGAGTGNITSKLLKRGFTDVTCVDISAEMLEELKKKTKLDASRIHCEDADSFLQRSGQEYGLAVLSSVVHHLPEYRKTLADLLDRLRPGGILYITHEPCSAPRDRSWKARYAETVMRKLDYALYVARYFTLVALGRMKLLGRDCRYSDYHTGERNVDPEAIRDAVAASGAEVRLVRYAVARSAWAARLVNGLSYNAYEMIIRKQKG